MDSVDGGIIRNAFIQDMMRLTEAISGFMLVDSHLLQLCQLWYNITYVLVWRRRHILELYEPLSISRNFIC